MLYVFICFYMFIAAKNNLWTKPPQRHLRLRFSDRGPPETHAGCSWPQGCTRSLRRLRGSIGLRTGQHHPQFFFDLFAVFTMFYHVFTPPVNLCQSNLRRGTLSNGKSLVQFFWIETLGIPVPVQHVGHTVAQGILKMVNCINCNLPTPSVQI